MRHPRRFSKQAHARRRLQPVSLASYPDKRIPGQLLRVSAAPTLSPPCRLEPPCSDGECIARRHCIQGFVVVSDRVMQRYRVKTCTVKKALGAVAVKLANQPARVGEYPHLYEAEPSLALSQKQLLTVCSPAPFRCMMTHVTTYLNGLPSATCEIVSAQGANWFKRVCTLQ